MKGIDDTLETWVSKSGPGTKAGADPRLVGAGDWLYWQDVMAEGNVELLTTENLIDTVWTEDNGRPKPEYKDIVVHDLEYAGEDWESKIFQLRGIFDDYSGMVVTELDEIAWLFNIRGEGLLRRCNI